MEYDIYTDGACLRNGKPSAIGGWSFVVCKKDTADIVGESYGKLRIGDQHCNRAEIEAVIQALKYVDSNLDDSGRVTYRIITDCEALCRCFKGFSDRKVNKDLWLEIEYLCLKIALKNGNIDMVHIKENKKNTDPSKYMYVMNNLADKYAKIGCQSFVTAPAQPIESRKEVQDRIINLITGEGSAIHG